MNVRLTMDQWRWVRRRMHVEDSDAASVVRAAIGEAQGGHDVSPPLASWPRLIHVNAARHYGGAAPPEDRKAARRICVRLDATLSEWVAKESARAGGAGKSTIIRAAIDRARGL